MKRISEFIAPLLLAVIPTILIWLPFILRMPSFWNIPLPKTGMATIVANYDGPLYLVVAKTFYNSNAIKENYPLNLPVEYYAAHFPAFPVLIRVFSPILGYPYAMLAVTIFSSFLALLFFNKLAKRYCSSSNALWLTVLFSFFPARWLIVRSIGSADPLFIAAIIASVYYFVQKKYLFAALWGALAQLTKSPAILLFIAYGISLLIPTLANLSTSAIFKNIKNHRSKTITEFLKGFPLLLIPLALVGVFFLYKSVFGDFFAYFHSGDNIHLFFPPFQVFNSSQPWVGTFWLEEVIFIYLAVLAGIIKLWKNNERTLAYIVSVFFMAIIMVSHRDVLRYALPVIPFLLIGFRDILSKREAKIVFAFILIPTFLFSLSFISQNFMSISDWTPFL